MTDRARLHLDYLMAHGDNIYEPHVETRSERWARWFGGPHYTFDYVAPSGYRMPLTDEQKRKFVPIEFSMSGCNVEHYRSLLNWRIANNRV